MSVERVCDKGCAYDTERGVWLIVSECCHLIHWDGIIPDPSAPPRLSHAQRKQAEAHRTPNFPVPCDGVWFDMNEFPRRCLSYEGHEESCQKASDWIFEQVPPHCSSRQNCPTCRFFGPGKGCDRRIGHPRTRFFRNTREANLTEAREKQVPYCRVESALRCQDCPAAQKQVAFDGMLYRCRWIHP